MPLFAQFQDDGGLPSLGGGGSFVSGAVPDKESSILYRQEPAHTFSHVHLWGDSKMFHCFPHYLIPAPSSLVFSIWVPVANS